MFACFGFEDAAVRKFGGGRHKEHGSSIRALQYKRSTYQEEPRTLALKAADSHATLSDQITPSSTVTDTTDRTQDAANETLRQMHPGAPSARDPHLATQSYKAEGVQNDKALGDAQTSSKFEAQDDVQHTSTQGDAHGIGTSENALHCEDSPSHSAVLDPYSRLDQVVSKVLASASMRLQEQHGSCTSLSKQGAEPPPSSHSGPLPPQTECHTVTLASLEQAARSQAAEVPLALLVLGHQLEAWERWQLRGSGRFERSSLALCDAAMAHDDAGTQGSNSAVLDDGILRGCSAGSNIFDVSDECLSPIHQACKHEMGTCVWLNDAFSKRLEAPSRQAALTTINQSISSNLTIQRHIAGFCRNVAVGKEDPVCFWSVLNPMLGAAQVEKICMWPCKLLDSEEDGARQPDVGCSAVLISVAEGVSRDVQHDVLLHQHVAYQLAPCMVTVLSTQGCIVTQNAESVAWLGCHSKEHSLRTSLNAGGMVPPRGLHQRKRTPTKEDQRGGSREEIPTKMDPQGAARLGEGVVHQSKSNPCGPHQAFCYLKELFYDQEDLMVEMQKVLGDQEPFVEKMEIRSPLLRAWMGAGEDEEVWHRVHIIRIVDPITCQPQYCLSQTDVTDVVYAERQVLQLQEQQSALLKEILPQQVVEHLLMHRSDMLNHVPSQGYSSEANLAPASTLAPTSDCKPPTPLSSRASLVKVNPACVPASAQTSNRKPPTPSMSRGSIFNTNPAPGSPLRHPSLRKPPTPSISRATLLNANPATGNPSHCKPPAPSASRGSLLSHVSRPPTFEAQQDVQGSETLPRLSEAARRINHSSSARSRMRTLENPAQGDDLSSQPLTIETKALRSKSFNEVCRNSPFPLSTKRDGQSLKTRPTSLDLLQLSLTNSAGQQGLGPDGASLTLKKLTQWPRSPSGGSIFSPSPRASLSEQQPSQESPPMQDTTPGLIWLTQQDVMDLATFHDNVTILFADIKGFTSMVNQLHPSQVMLFLNSLYSVWDSLLETFGVYKIETIGDCYMCCTGLFCYDEATGTKRLGGNDPQHARTMLDFAKAMIWSSQAIKTPLGDTVQVRVGLHSGSCSSGVVGQRMPRFCLFGDTVNTANRMESNGLPGCIHASEATVKMLEGEPWKSTGGIVAKGKGLMQTSLLPVLPGADHAAAAFIADRRAASSAIRATGESSTGLPLGSMCGEGSTHGGQLQLQRSTTGLLSSPSATSYCPEESPRTVHTCEVPPFPSHPPIEAFREGQKDPTQHARPSLLGTESSGIPAFAEAGAVTEAEAEASSLLGTESPRMSVSAVAGAVTATEEAAAEARALEAMAEAASAEARAYKATAGAASAQAEAFKASAEAGAVTATAGAAAIPAAGWPYRHCLSCPGQTPGTAADFEGIAADSRGGGDEHLHSTSKTSNATARGVGKPALATHGRNPSGQGGLNLAGQCSVLLSVEQPTPLCGDTSGEPSDAPHIIPQQSTAARHADPGTSQPSSSPSAPWSLSHQCESSDINGTGHDAGQGAWSTFEQGRTSALQGHHTSEQELPYLLQGAAPVGQGHTASKSKPASEHERSSLPKGAWSILSNTEHSARLSQAGGEGELCYVSEPSAGASGITLYPGSRSPTRRGDSVDHTPAGSAACATDKSLTFNPGDESGGGTWVGGWESSRVWGVGGREGESWQRKGPHVSKANGGQEAAPGGVEGMAEKCEAAEATHVGRGPPPEQQQWQQQQQQHLLMHKHAHSSPHRQRLPMCPAGSAPGSGGSWVTSADGSAHPNVYLLSSLFAPAVSPPPQNQQQQQQQQREQHHGQVQLMHQHQLAPVLQQRVRSATADLGRNRSPPTPSSLSSQGSGGFMPGMGGSTTLVRTMSDMYSSRNVQQSQSRLESSSAEHKTSPALCRRSKEVGEGEGLASVMDGCQQLVDSVTSRVLQQLQESRPEPQARHAHPSETRPGPLGPWASRRSLDLSSNDLRGTLSSSGRLGGAKFTRKSRGPPDRRGRNASLSLDVFRPAPSLAFPRQVSQPSPRAQAQTRQGVSPVQRSPLATATQPVTSDE